MAKKTVNRKKQLRKQLADLRRASKDLADVAVQKVQETTEQVAEAAGHVVESVTERVHETVENLTHKTEETKTKAKKTAEKAEKSSKQAAEKASKTFEDFAEKFEGVASARLETFYEEGIKSVKDFANWTEKELLELKGIGPATIKQLKELGVKLKK
ncbi:helix-hairpin-helix domain-containing protein [Streptococcus caprae]|uniref:Helix-hairpin-helix domain-containing protein n=1 Tax=Streptococcus caprae TaxID=1640501 RepID=A0ABV8CXA6_9STRE